MKKKKLKLSKLKVESFTTSEIRSIKGGSAIVDDLPPSDDTGGSIPTWNAEGCHSAIEFNCTYTQNNQVGCVL